MERFRAEPDPIAALGDYLAEIVTEAAQRGYRYDRTKIIRNPGTTRIEVPEGQLALERDHLAAKLATRSPELAPLPAVLDPHPIFTGVPGGPAAWERGITR